MQVNGIKYHFIPIRLTIILKSDNIKCWERSETMGIKAFWRPILQYQIKTYNPAILFLDICMPGKLEFELGLVGWAGFCQAKIKGLAFPNKKEQDKQGHRDRKSTWGTTRLFSKVYTPGIYESQLLHKLASTCYYLTFWW